MTETPKKTTRAKKTPPKKAPKPGYFLDDRGNWVDETCAEFQTIVAAGGTWFGVP